MLLQPFLKSHTKNNLLHPGRIVIVECLPKYSARLGVILECIPPKSNPPSKFRVLILTSTEDSKSYQEKGYEMSTILDPELMSIEEIKENFEVRFGQILHFAHPDLIRFTPQLNQLGYFTHTIVEIDYYDILEIVEKSIRVDSETIMANIKSREAPRFA